MSGFLGEYSPNITEGSRITLPKKLRKYIRGAEVVLSKGFEKCIFIYNREDWMNSAQKQVAELLTLSQEESTDLLKQSIQLMESP